jgi:hypothetical protein
MTTSHSLRQQKAMDDYIKRIKLKQLFKCLLHEVVLHQPDKPFDYMHEMITKIKQEMDDNNIDIGSTTFLTNQFPSIET